MRYCHLLIFEVLATYSFCYIHSKILLRSSSYTFHQGLHKTAQHVAFKRQHKLFHQPLEQRSGACPWSTCLVVVKRETDVYVHMYECVSRLWEYIS